VLETDFNAIPLDDRGLLLGDGLFETLPFTAGALILPEAHAQRMADGATALGLPAPSPEAFVAAARAAVVRAGMQEARAAVRVTLTAGSGGRGLNRPAMLSPRLFATAASAAIPTEPATLMIAATRRNHASPASRLKTLAYLDNVLARREAAAAGADEAIMLNTLGEVACAATANLFWLKSDVLMTPALETGRLDGVMARQVIEAAAGVGLEVRQVRQSPTALADAAALFLTNSLVGVRPAHLLGQLRPPPHPVVERLAAAVSRLV
jgi:branched-chain amino acid aminotransferase/4-amino-4-deoxychorismate lyase